MNVTIKLDSRELFSGATEGVMRQVSAINANRTPADGHDNSDAWEINVGGSLSEMAVAKYLGKYWSGTEGIGANDVGGFEVRSTKRTNGCLRIRPEDPNEKNFILVINRCPHFDIVGWFNAGAAKQDRFWDVKSIGRPGAYWVPQSELKDIKELRNSA